MKTDTPQKNYSHVVWDWNGTLFDDVETSYEVINGVLLSRKLRPLTDVQEYQRAFCFPISKYYERLGFDFEVEPFESLAHVYMDAYDQASRSCDLFPPVRSTLESIKDRSVTQVVLTASEKQRIHQQLHRLDARPYFDSVLALDDCYAHSKLEVGKRWVDSASVDPSDVLLVGDTTHDYEVASTLGFDCVLVQTGHQSSSQLETTSCPVIENVSEVLRFC